MKNGQGCSAAVGAHGCRRCKKVFLCKHEFANVFHQTFVALNKLAYGVDGGAVADELIVRHAVLFVGLFEIFEFQQVG